MNDKFEQISLKELEEFDSNYVWMYIKDVLNSRLEMIRNELEVGYILKMDGDKTVAVNLTYSDLKFRMGECATIRYFIDKLIPGLIQEKKNALETNK